MELMKLLDNAPPFKDEKAIKIIQSELKGNIRDLFQSFDGKHIAAASFGQVYRAVLPSGDPVAVKVLRPGIRPIVYAELAFLKFLVRIIDFSCILGTLRLAPFIDDFAIYTKEELDYLQEARYMRKIRGGPVKNSMEKIPRVFERYTTDKVLTSEFLEGVWMTDILNAIHTNNTARLEEFKSAGIDMELVAKNLMLNLLIQAFEKNYFHADPHAANICIMENNVIGYVDFGIVGRMDNEFKENTLRYLRSFFNDDIDGAYIALLDIIRPPESLDLSGFEREMKTLMATWLEDVRDPGAPLSDRSALRRMVREGKIMRKYNLYFPEVTSRFYRLLMITDVIILQLAPDLDVVELTTQYLKKMATRKWVKKIAKQNFLEFFIETVYLLTTLPKRIEGILSRSEKLVKRSDKVLGNLRRIPAKIFAFIGKLCFIAFLFAIVMNFIFRDNIFQKLGMGFDPMTACLALLAAAIVSIWLSRYILSR
jgi:ubiquinone biosynthesis protein